MEKPKPGYAFILPAELMSRHASIRESSSCPSSHVTILTSWSCAASHLARRLVCHQPADMAVRSAGKCSYRKWATRQIFILNHRDELYLRWLPATFEEEPFSLRNLKGLPEHFRGFQCREGGFAARVNRSPLFRLDPAASSQPPDSRHSLTHWTATRLKLPLG